MALSFAHGAVQWLAADAATTVYTVSGLAFQPKALRFYWNGLQSATDADSEALSSRRGVGFAVSTSDRRCVASLDTDASASTACPTGSRDDAIAATVTTAPAFDGLLDLNSITSDGFTLIVDDAAPVNLTVFWEAWGGSDITVAATGVAPVVATGDADYTVTGFAVNAIDQVVMFAGVQTLAAENSATAENSGLNVGFASGPNAANNIVVYGGQDHASAAADTDGYCDTGLCIVKGATPGGDANTSATLTAWIANGFRLTWVGAIFNRRNIWLAIKGGNWRAGSYTIEGQTLNATATVNGLGFTPIGVCLMGRMTAEQTYPTVTAQDRISLGTGTSTTSRRSMGHLSEDAVDPTEIDLTLQYDQVLCFPSDAGALLTAYDIAAMDVDGFSIINDLAGGVTAEWHGYLVFGNSPSSPVFSQSITSRSLFGNHLNKLFR